MDELGDLERTLMQSLEADAYFRDWLDQDRLFTREDIDRAIAMVLGSVQETLPPLPGAQDRAMARLALFQVVATHLDDQPTSWSQLLGRLSQHEMGEVDAILGSSTLGEILE